jgi:hypothetical protein
MGWITNWFFPKDKGDTPDSPQQTQDGLFEGLGIFAMLIGLVVIAMNFFKDKKGTTAEAAQLAADPHLMPTPLTQPFAPSTVSPQEAPAGSFTPLTTPSAPAPTGARRPVPAGVRP